MPKTNKPAAADDFDAAAQVFSEQARSLDKVFKRALKDGLEGDFMEHGDMRIALKAQAQCRATFKILLELRDARAAEKFADSSERTIADGNSPA